MSSRAHRHIFMFTSVSCLALMSGCSTVNSWMDSFSGSGKREPQIIEGARRQPVLNRGMAVPMQPGVASQAMPAPQAPMVPKGSYETNPYDYFDEQGNRIQSDSTNQPEEETQEPAAPAPQSKAVSKPVVLASMSDTSARKPLAQNEAHYPTKTQAVAPLPPAPELSPAAGGETAEPVVLAASEPAAPAPVVETASAPAAEESGAYKPSWLSRGVSSVKGWVGLEDEQPETLAAPPAAIVPTPALSSVPPAPQEFQVIKAESPQMVQDMQMSHDLAQEEKFMLDSEPSGEEQAAMPEGQTTPLPWASAPASPPQEMVAAPQEQETPAREVVLNNASEEAPMTPIVPMQSAVEMVQPVLSSPAAEEPVVAQPQLAEPEATVAVSPAIQQPSSVPEPQVVIAAPQVQETPPPAPVQAAAAPSTTLPSPEILKTIKTLPPSRYRSRALSASY